jgi:hypothetical protein
VRGLSLCPVHKDLSPNSWARGVGVCGCASPEKNRLPVGDRCTNTTGSGILATRTQKGRVRCFLRNLTLFALHSPACSRKGACASCSLLFVWLEGNRKLGEGADGHLVVGWRQGSRGTGITSRLASEYRHKLLRERQRLVEAGELGAAQWRSRLPCTPRYTPPAPGMEMHSGRFRR